MGAWIMSIVGVICLGLLLEIVLPEGQTSKYVRGAFSLLVVFVIAAPLPKLLGNEWRLNLDGYTFEVDDKYVNSTYTAYTQNTAANLEKYLSENGYAARVKIAVEDKMPITLKSVEVTVTNFKAETAPEKLISEKLGCDRKTVSVIVSPS